MIPDEGAIEVSSAFYLRQFSDLSAGSGIPNTAIWPHWVEEAKIGFGGGQDGSVLRSRLLERRELCRERVS